MFSETPELYDAIYGAWKDYGAESERVARLLREVAPGARSVLDVGCGTGEHAVRLQRDHGYRVHGVDIEPGFVELARGKLPEATFTVGDMASFDVGARFDVVMCLFSSIGYVETVERLEATLQRFRAHLRPDGVAVVEPWFEPADWHPGRVYVHTAEAGALQVVRMSHSRVEGSVSKLEFHYLIGGGEGIDHRIEHHSLGLFTREEMTHAFSGAGFDEVRFDPEGLIGRGLYVAHAEG